MKIRETLKEFENYSPCKKEEKLFYDKLMEENTWTHSFTKDAVSEYLKFLKIVKVYGVKQTPSKIVDEVWHMHLQFTKDYWEYLCPKILGFSLHHIPSTKDIDSETINRIQYNQTLENYKDMFGDPPTRFWGSAETVTSVETKRDPESKIFQKYAVGVLCVFLLIGTLGVPNFNFFPTVSGQSFLILFGLLILIAYILSFAFVCCGYYLGKISSGIIASIFLLSILGIFGSFRVFHGLSNSYPVFYLFFEMLLGLYVIPLFSYKWLSDVFGIENPEWVIKFFNRPSSGSPGFDSSCSSSCTSSSCSSGCGGCGGGD